MRRRLSRRLDEDWDLVEEDDDGEEGMATS